MPVLPRRPRGQVLGLLRTVQGQSQVAEDGPDAPPVGRERIAHRDLDPHAHPPHNLNSCVADTLAFKALLQERYQFDAASITLLHNQDATLEGVRAGLDTLLDGAQVGDELVYLESSHGRHRAGQGPG
jgi:hypothetical protein